MKLGAIIQKMISFTTLIYFLLCFLTISEAGKKNSIDKIIIHVPYKIHKHHHIHTKYKVITVPVPKKENTVIYLKEDIQPITQHVPSSQTHAEMSETHFKTSDSFIPPHQQSASGLLENIINHKKHITQTNQQHQYSTVINDQKPLESHYGQTSQGFIPSFKPVVVTPHENLLPNIPFKSVFYPLQHSLTPKFLINPVIHQSYDFLPKFIYQPMFHQTQGHINPKYTFKPMHIPSNNLQDSVGHSSNHVNKTIITSRPKTITPYKVKEELLENHKTPLNNHQHLNSNRIPVPSKYYRRGKSYPPTQTHFNSQIKNIRNVMPSDSDFEYEHVGYLIIDGNSRSIVGKNFEGDIQLSA